MTETPAIIIQNEQKSPANTAIIWLHGLGADGNDFVPVVDSFTFDANTNMRFIFPHAPVRPVTINAGYQMRAWYDITSMSIVDGEDETGIKQSSAFLADLCEQQISQGIDPKRLFIAGFSQGGAIALHCGSRLDQTLGGIIALSTYLPLPKSLPAECSSTALNTPIFMAHGSQDDVVDIRNGKNSHHMLQSQGFDITWLEYSMQHSVCPEEISDINQWLNNKLAV